MLTPPRAVALIGAGPVGLDLAYRLKLQNIPYFHFDQGCLGHSLLGLPSGTVIGTGPDIQLADLPLPEAATYRSDAYLAYLRTVARQRQLAVRTFERVCGIHRLGAQWQLRTTGHNQVCHQYRVRYLIFATGNRGQRRASLFPGAESPVVQSEFRHPHFYFQRTVLIIGSSPAAQDVARQCAGIAKRVFLCSSAMRLQPTPSQPGLRQELIRLIQHDRVTYLPGCQVQSLHGERALLRSDDGSLRTVEVDFLLPQRGYEPDYTLPGKLGIALKGPHMAPVHDPDTMETNVPGCYVAGSIVLGTTPDDRAIPCGRRHARRIVAALKEQLEDRNAATLPRQRWLPATTDWSWWLPRTTRVGGAPVAGT